jgi:hypothetical protein
MARRGGRFAVRELAGVVAPKLGVAEAAGVIA